MALIDVISLGAGVQSSTMSLMAAHGLITPMPACAIFADTGWEPRAVYDWLDWLTPRLPFPVHTVSKGNIRKDNITARVRGARVNGERWASLPYFTRLAGQTKEGRVRRQCTSEYKIEPIEAFIKRDILAIPKGHRLPKAPLVRQWRGISIDEASRMKPSRVKWMTIRYPLAMEYRMTRTDCLQWMVRHGYPQPPRSACIGCPFHSNTEWRRMRDTAPQEWQDACDFDEAIRPAGGARGDTFLHRSCQPLRQVDLSTAKEHGQLSLWANECEGLCGL